ncbi:hypothetical protein F4779DRAFT_637927 [Xylariaceae sp. FL0662B]|nr:hypothetical protein F4779DRAFT_637927 [Xylariaceae sp. FL0662B]
MNRRRESQIRLEALGGLSDYYSDVASVSGRSDTSRAIADDDDWDVASSSSKASTVAVVFDKPPPPGRLLRPQNRQVSEVDRPSPSPGLSMRSYKRTEVENDHLAGRLRQAREEQVPAKSFTESETLSRSRHPTITRPASALPSKAMSDYGGDSYVRPRSSNWAPKTPVYVSSMPDWERRSSYGGSSTRPISTYSAYQPSQRVPSQSRPRAARRPTLNLYGAPMRDSSADDDLRSDYSNATYSFAPRTANPLARSGVQSTRVSELSELNNRRASFSHAPAPTPAPAPAPVLTAPRPPLDPTRGRGSRRMSNVSVAPPSPRRSPSPSRGAWTSDAPRQKRASFIDRAQERMEKSIHTHMVKAGQRPLPSFEVKRVCRSPVEDVAAWQAKRPTQPPAPPGKNPRLPFAMLWRQRLSRHGHRATAAAELPADVPPRPAVAAAEPPPEPRVDRAYPSIYRPPVQRGNDELFGAAAGDRTSGLFEPKWVSANFGPARRTTPELRIDTDIALTPPAPATPVTADFPTPPLRTAPVCADSASGSTVSHSGSLFLPRKAIRSPADYSFFASEYAQRQAEAQTQPPRPLSMVGPESASARPAFSREQLELAALPSGLDLSMPLDDRRRLPSQGPSRGLTRKKARGQLR